MWIPVRHTPAIMVGHLCRHRIAAIIIQQFSEGALPPVRLETSRRPSHTPSTSVGIHALRARFVATLSAIFAEKPSLGQTCARLDALIELPQNPNEIDLRGVKRQIGRRPEPSRVQS